MSNTPLEVAYRWTLACWSVMLNEINFFGPLKDQTKQRGGQRWTFEINCENVEEGRIFDNDKIIQINDNFVKNNVTKNTLYYVQEGKGYETHPPFNLFFLCKHKNKDTLVTIDVTGDGIKIAENKLERISKWIRAKT